MQTSVPSAAPSAAGMDPSAPSESPATPPPAPTPTPAMEKPPSAPPRRRQGKVVLPAATEAVASPPVLAAAARTLPAPSAAPGLPPIQSDAARKRRRGPLKPKDGAAARKKTASPSPPPPPPSAPPVVEPTPTPPLPPPPAPIVAPIASPASAVSPAPPLPPAPGRRPLPPGLSLPPAPGRRPLPPARTRARRPLTPAAPGLRPLPPARRHPGRPQPSEVAAPPSAQSSSPPPPPRARPPRDGPPRRQAQLQCGPEDNTLMKILSIAAFAVSGYAYTDGRNCKPFNPLLGETYDADYPDKGLRFSPEKVNHHPIVVACHSEGTSWRSWAGSNLKSKFWGRSIQLDPVGVLTLEFDDGEVFQWSKARKMQEVGGNLGDLKGIKLPTHTATLVVTGVPEKGKKKSNSEGHPDIF